MPNCSYLMLKLNHPQHKLNHPHSTANISIDDALDVNQLQPSPSRRRSSASSSAKLQDTKHVNFSKQNIVYEDDTPNLRASLSLQKDKEAIRSSATIDSNATVGSNTRVPRDADDFFNEEEIESNREWKVVAGKSAFVLFHDVNSCVQYKVSTTWLFYLTVVCLYLLPLYIICTNRSYYLLYLTLFQLG